MGNIFQVFVYNEALDLTCKLKENQEFARGIALHVEVGT